MKALTAIAALLLLGACSKDPIQSTQTDNRDLSVDILANVDGCRIYRFEDAAHYVYFTRCGSSTATQSWYTCGKNCIKEQFSLTENDR